MSINDTQGCSRCRDYDEIKNDLKKQKEKIQDSQKTALSECEEKRTNLQRKLTRAGVAAVIGGTILGKEFVDNVVSYIESFNKVAEVVPGLVGSVTPSSGGAGGPTSSQSASSKPQKKKDEEKDEHEKEDKKSDPYKPPFSPYSNVNPFPILADMNGDLSSPLESVLNDAFETPESIFDQNLASLTDPVIDFPIIPRSNDFVMDFRIADPIEPNYFASMSRQSSVIPAPPTLALLLLPLLFRKRRKR